MTAHHRHRPGWSDENEEMLQEASKSHFIDVATRRLTIRHLAPALQRPAAAFVDVGCSTGWLVDEVSFSFPLVTTVGIDYFAAGLQKLRRRQTGVRAVRADLNDTPFRDAAFDACACLNVLEHVENDVAALTEVYRILRPGGRAFVVVPACPSLYDFYDEVHLHYRRYTRRDLKEKLRQAGFSILHLNFMGVLFFPPFYVTKKLAALRMRGRSVADRQRQVIREIRRSQSLFGANIVMRAEDALGHIVTYPIGIRLYSCVTRTPNGTKTRE